MRRIALGICLLLLISALSDRLAAQGWRGFKNAPAGESGQKYADGSAVCATETHICALKGEYNEVYFYDPAGDSWICVSVLPFVGRSGLRVPARTGASLASVGSTIYCVKGGRTLEFWSAIPDSEGKYVWRQGPDVPAGPYNLKVGAGAALTALDSFVYLLKGNGSGEFYRYSTIGCVWSAMADIPVGASGKGVAGGGALASTPDGLLCLKGNNSSEFYAWDPSADEWTSLNPVPPGASGRAVGTGASLAFSSGVAYCLKGNSTVEFWPYSVTSGTWGPAASDYPHERRATGEGAGLCSYEDYVYALAGDLTDEFWGYRLPVAVNERPAGNWQGTRLMVFPNPSHGIVSVKLPSECAGRGITVSDVHGRVVQRRCTTSQSRIDLRSLADGVYLLSLEGQFGAAVEKIVLSRRGDER